MAQVIITFPVDQSTPPGGTVVIYGDAQSGTVDYMTPLSQNVPVRSVGTQDVVWLDTPWLAGPWLDPRGSQGWLCGLWLADPWHGFHDVIAVMVDVASGMNKFGARFYDTAGAQVAQAAEIGPIAI